MKIKFVLFERTLEMIKELHLYIVFPYRSSFLRYCDLFDNFNDISTFTTTHDHYIM